jgi:hypothetical protein
LDDGGEMEFVPCTREAPRPHAFEAVMDLQVRETPSTFAFVAGFVELWRTDQRAGMVSDVLIDVPCDLGRRRLTRLEQ